MKRNKNIFLLLIAVLLTASSCNKFLDVNDDPNRVTDKNVTPNLIFTQAENAVGYRQAARFIFLNNWMGYWSRSGTFIVEQEETTYKISSTFPEANWNYTYNTLFDLYLTKTKALAVGDSVLAGSAMVLSAKLWQEMVDQFGNIPYTKAFDYTINPHPVYDDASAIYADLLVQLDAAIAYLNAVAPKSSFAKSDIIFARGGNVEDAAISWKKLANTIKLRLFLRQSEKSFVPSAAQMAKIATDGGFFGAGEDVSVNPGYSNSTDKQNPFYSLYGKTPSGAPATTNNKPNNYFVKTILGNTDPRLTRFFAATIAGTDYGALGGNHTDPNATIVGSEIGPGLAGSPEQDQFLIPSFESLFFQAEATVRGWLPGGDAGAQALFESAMKQSFRWLKTSKTPTLLSGDALADSLYSAYLSAVSTAKWANSGPTAAEKIIFIAYQKYIALCGIDPLESWSDMRRLGIFIPAGYLSWNAQRAASLPNVLTYPQSEVTTNKANVPERNTTTIFTEKLFWQP